MAERRVDVPSLVVGLLALTAALLVLLDRTGALEVDEAVGAATLLLVLGVAGLVRSVQLLVSGRRPPG